MCNRLLALQKYGQSVWYDNIERGLLISGELQRMISEDGVRGLTSNPAIFEKAILGSGEYADVLEARATSGCNAQEIYEAIAVEDIQWAADLMSQVYQESDGADGFVSLEVSPHLANDTQKTIEEAWRLARAVGRDNLMIKIPGTPAGIPAVEELVSQGLNVNITLLFARENYEQVAEAYIAGLEKLASNGGQVDKVASVASFFISRIDTMADEMIADRLDKAATVVERLALVGLLGKVAVANARLAYVSYLDFYAGSRWLALADRGARPQRLLWASTSTKNPAYRDVLYVEELVGANTVNTMPQNTLEAFRNSGVASATLASGLDQARDVMAGLEELGLSMREMADRLQLEAVRLFVEPYDKLLAAIQARCTEIRKLD